MGKKKSTESTSNLSASLHLPTKSTPTKVLTSSQSKKDTTNDEKRENEKNTIKTPNKVRRASKKEEDLDKILKEIMEFDLKNKQNSSETPTKSEQQTSAAKIIKKTQREEDLAAEQQRL